MSEFKVNTEMFGKYAIIPTGYSKEPHIYKIVSSFYSNSYCDIPIVYNSEPTAHESIKTSENEFGLEHCLNVIHCGIDETKVVRVALKDCKIVQPKTNAERIRNMTDEELYNLIEKAKMCGGLLRAEESSSECRGCKDGFCCNVLQWLKSESEVSDER